jgi:hypothetical protein
MSIEAWIEQQPGISTGGVAAPAVLTAETSPSLACRQSDHDRRACRLCAPLLTQGEPEETLELPVVAPLVTGSTPAPIAAPTPIPVSDDSPAGLVLKAASELANAINACMRLSSKIVGLELSLESARAERDVAESAKAIAQEALKKLVVQ